MQREIKFKGKRVDNGEWIEGDLYKFKDICFIIPEYSKKWSDNGGDPDFDLVHVFKETVCQYTGLEDKNGVEIYKGDIVKSVCKKQKPIKDIDDLFHIYEYEDKIFYNVIDWYQGIKISGWRIKGKIFQTQLKRSTINNMNIEVIGNIFDNQDLLK